jgi:hypothetical protein
VLAATHESTAVRNTEPHFTTKDVFHFNDNLFAGIGSMSFAFVCQHNSFIIFRSLKLPTLGHWKRVAHISISFALLVSVSLAFIGIMSFYPFVQGDLLNNFPSDSISISVARMLLAGTMVFTYPMELFVSRHCLLSIYYRWKRRRHEGVTHEAGLESTADSSVLHEGESVLFEEGTALSPIVSTERRLRSDLSGDRLSANMVQCVPSSKHISSEERCIGLADKVYTSSENTSSSSGGEDTSATNNLLAPSSPDDLVNVSIDGEFIFRKGSEAARESDLEEYHSSADSFESIDFNHFSPPHQRLSPLSHLGGRMRNDRSSPANNQKMPIESSEAETLAAPHSIMNIVRRVVSPTHAKSPHNGAIPINSPLHAAEKRSSSSSISSSAKVKRSDTYMNVPTNSTDAVLSSQDTSQPLHQRDVEIGGVDLNRERHFLSSKEAFNLSILSSGSSKAGLHQRTSSQMEDRGTVPLGSDGDDHGHGPDGDRSSSFHATDGEHVFITIILWASTLLIAVFAGDLSLVTALTGILIQSMYFSFLLLLRGVRTHQERWLPPCLASSYRPFCISQCIILICSMPC